MAYAKVLPILLALCFVSFTQCGVVFSTNFTADSSPLDTEATDSLWLEFELPLSNYRANAGFIRPLSHCTELVVQYNKTLPIDSPVCWSQIAQYAVVPKASPFYVSKTDKIQLKAHFSARSFDTEAHPYGSAVKNAEDDPRLSAMGVRLVNVKYGLTADIFLTNEGIYTFQNSMGCLLFTGPLTRLWTSGMRVADRIYSQIHSVVIEYDRYLNTLSWSVDGESVASWDNPGHPAFQLLEERVSGSSSVTLPPSELAHWTVFIWNGHFPGAALSNSSLGLVDLNSGCCGGYVSPKSFVFNQPYSREQLIYGATGVMTLYNFSVEMYPS